MHWSLLENSLSNNLTTKVSLVLVCPVKYVCENVVGYNYYLAKEYHKDQLLFQLLQLAFVSQTVVESGYYDTESSIQYISNLKTQPFF